MPGTESGRIFDLALPRAQASVYFVPLRDEEMSSFTFTLTDSAGHPALTVDYTALCTLTNIDTGDLVITPFAQGGVSESQYHLAIAFSPAALIVTPTLPQWDILAVADSSSAKAISILYLAYTGPQPLTIVAQDVLKLNLSYNKVIKESTDSIQYSVHTGHNVTIGGNPIPNQIAGPHQLSLRAPSVSSGGAAPIAVEFIGRRTLLNDGKTQNALTFALTNLTNTKLDLLAANDPAGSTTFQVWFETAFNDATPSSDPLAPTFN